MLDMLGITALINVSSNCPNHFEDHYQYKSIPVEDNHKANISSWFNEAIEFIGEDHFSLILFKPLLRNREQMSPYEELWQAGRQADSQPNPHSAEV